MWVMWDRSFWLLGAEFVNLSAQTLTNLRAVKYHLNGAKIEKRCAESVGKKDAL
jgi:hypothetical protein